MRLCELMSSIMLWSLETVGSVIREEIEKQECFSYLDGRTDISTNLIGLFRKNNLTIHVPLVVTGAAHPNSPWR